ncbi:MAG: hypothetical protein KDA85_01225, partial [Planctomycetaceae bacterium]|nr:hypothetical protein [Planctomycetaceae bacterium]
HGLSLARPRCVQFFHYPPIRLLALRNYLDDPVPRRCEELLVANGVPSPEEARRFEAVMDSCPIGASDEQGQLGTIPIDEFYDYQAAQTRLLLEDPADTVYDNRKGWKKPQTIPVVVYGQHPKRVFSKLFLDERTKVYAINGQGEIEARPNGVIDDDTVCVASNIIPGKKTAAMGSTHPYAFYGTAQVGPFGLSAKQQGTIGQGFIHPAYNQKNCESIASRMIRDLIVAGWQASMADNPKQQPEKVLQQVTQHWQDPAQRPTVMAHVIHQGSLWYPCLDQGKIPVPDDPQTLCFEWKVSLADAAALCQQHNYDLAACITALHQLATGGAAATAKPAASGSAAGGTSRKAAKGKSSKTGPKKAVAKRTR